MKILRWNSLYRVLALPSLAAVLTTVLLVTGCGAQKRDRQPDAQSAEQTRGKEDPETELAGIGRRLGLQVAEEESRPGYPGTRSPAKSEPDVFGSNDFLIDGNEIQLKGKLDLGAAAARNRPLYLVWSEGAFGSPIRHAQYEHRIQDESNRAVGVPRQRLVTPDRETGRLFIPIAELFEGNLLAINPTELQLLRIDLVLADGSKVEVRIRFSARGILNLASLSWGGDAVLPKPRPVPGYLSHGYVWAEETIGNRQVRPLRLWLRVSELRLTATYAVYPVTFRPTFVTPHYSQAGLNQAEIRIGGSAVGGNGRHWQSVVLAPGEAVAVQWVAKADPGTPTCPDPGLLSGLKDLQIVGTTGRELALSEAYEDGPAQLLGRHPATEAHQGGGFGGPVSGAHSCQGIF